MYTRVSMEVIVTSDCKLVEITYLLDLQPAFTGIIIHLLSTMDIPVNNHFLPASSKWPFDHS